MHSIARISYVVKLFFRKSYIFFGDDTMYEIFAELLSQKDAKAADVCKATGLPSSLFSEWKKGKSTPKIDKMQKIADYFGVSVQYLMGENEKQETPSFFMSDTEKEIILKIRLLNKEGIKKLTDYADDLISSGRYEKLVKRDVAI